MRIEVVQLWSSYLPWQAGNYPWMTVPVDGQVTVTNPTPNLKYGIKLFLSSESLSITQPTSTLKYGIKFLVDTASILISVINPKRIGSVWERIIRVLTAWEKEGTILWSKNVLPWESSFFPWLIGGERAITYTNQGKPTTNYQNTLKPTTNYANQQKPTTSYNNINKPTI